ncbi:MAG: hypothetical protein COV70_01375 [Parcubacteria group bacterium CG11_big_fil_rev_8_21_14_0_20_39_22]|nr:MAG: hypothetical protein COV70_01375 [Parcubacteria group bacterium CG11_big_fil_rev_8_21_14_0_20_39_22]
MKENKKILRWGIITAAVLIIIFVSFYLTGYRLTTTGIVRTGVLEIVAPRDNFRLFIDNVERTKDVVEGESLIFRNVTPGKHEVIVTYENFWPWFKQVEVTPNQKTIVKPFIVNSTPDGEVITKDNESYDSIREAVESNVLPSVDNPKISADSTIAIWVENETDIYAKPLSEEYLPEFLCDLGEANVSECLSGKKIWHSDEPIRDLSFYKERNDVIVFSSGYAVFALEMDKTIIQNIQSIFKGGQPYFTTGKTPEEYYIVDDNLEIVVVVRP